MKTPLPQRLSVAAHAKLPHANPLSALQMADLVASVTACAPRTALDIGCGPASFAIALAQSAPIQVTAVDNNPAFLARASAEVSQLALQGGIVFVEEMPGLANDAENEAKNEAEFDAVICIGSSQVFGAPGDAIQACRSLVKAGGIFVFAELVWSNTPDPEFLEFLAAPADYYWPREAGVAKLSAAGWRAERQLQASPASFQEYEDAVRQARLEFAETLAPEDKALVLQRAHAWSAMYQKHGVHCLGFDAYVARAMV